MACSINFPLLERLFVNCGFTVERPADDEHRDLHCRLLAKGPGPRTVNAFHNAFGQEAYQSQEDLRRQARDHLCARRVDKAAAAYVALVERFPQDWWLLADFAEFVLYNLNEPGAALSVAGAALELNPGYSPRLWCVRGDILIKLERRAEAAECYSRALAIDPRSCRAAIGLTEMLRCRGAHAEALQTIAIGLAHASAGGGRERLLLQQSQILAKLQEPEERAVIQSSLLRATRN